jgi:hypothetical protein
LDPGIPVYEIFDSETFEEFERGIISERTIIKHKDVSPAKIET